MPKTAGNSIARALSDAFGVELELWSRPHHKLPFDGQRDLLTGHLWFYPGEQLRAGWRYATILRDPVDRSISQYYFNRLVAATPSPPDDPQVRLCGTRELEELLRHGSTDQLAFVSNVQARHFAAREVLQPETLDPDELFRAAVNGLSDYDVVGSFDDLGGFLERCWEVSTPSLRPSLPSLNVGERDPVSDAARDALAELNRVDLRLVEWARTHQHRDRPRASARPARVEFGSRELEIESARISTQIEGSDFVVTIPFTSRRAVPDLQIGVELSSTEHVFGTNTRLLRRPVVLDRPGRYAATFTWTRLPPPGEYSVTVALHRGIDHRDGCFHWLDPAAEVVVDPVRAAQVGGVGGASDATFMLTRLDSSVAVDRTPPAGPRLLRALRRVASAGSVRRVR